VAKSRKKKKGRFFGKRKEPRKQFLKEERAIPIHGRKKAIPQVPFLPQRRKKGKSNPSISDERDNAAKKGDYLLLQMGKRPPRG